MVEQLPVYIATDPDSGDPSAMAQFSVAAGDVTPCTILTTTVRAVIEEVVTKSPTWDEGGAASVPGSISGLWEGATLFTQGASAVIGTDGAGITTNITNIAANVTDIATQTARVDTNVTNIAANVTDIAANDTDIAANTASIGVNSDNVGVMGGTSAILDLPLAGNVLTVTGLVLTEGAGGNIDMGNRSIKNCTQLSATAIKTDLNNILEIRGTTTATPTLKGRESIGIGLNLSALELSAVKSYLPVPVVKAAGELASVPLSGYGNGDDVPDAIGDGFGYVYNAADDRFYARNLVFQSAEPGATGPFANPTVAITNSTLSEVHFTADLSSGSNIDLTVGGDLYVSGGSQFAKTLVVSSQNSVATMTGALPTMASLSCPSPPGGFCFLSAVGDGTAGTSEISFGEGTIVQGVSSVGRGGEDGYYMWDADNSELEVSADGVYKVEFVGITEVAAALTITVSFYTGSTLVHRYDIRVHSVTDPHNLVGTWVGFVRTTEPISVTINSGSGDNAQLMQSSTMFVQRLA